MEGFKKNLTDVETYLSGLESNTNAQIEAARWSRGHEVNGGSTDDKIRELAGVLREFEAGIIGVAGKVGKAREGVLEVMLNEGNGRRR